MKPLFIYKVEINLYSEEPLHNYYSHVKKIFYVETIEKARLILNCAEAMDFKNKALDNGMIVPIQLNKKP